MNGMNWWGQTNATSGWWPQITTSGTSGVYYPAVVYQQPPPLPSVLDGPSAPLDDREWLDAQIAEVCDLAVAA